MTDEQKVPEPITPETQPDVTPETPEVPAPTAPTEISPDIIAPGTEEIDSEDITLPRLKLLQKGSKEADKDQGGK